MSPAAWGAWRTECSLSSRHSSALQNGCDIARRTREEQQSGQQMSEQARSSIAATSAVCLSSTLLLDIHWR